MSPCTRRTQRPSLRSMAGNRITRDTRLKVREAGAGCSRAPAQEIRDQRQSEALALLRMELRTGEVVPSDDRRHRPTVIAVGDDIARMVSLQGVAVHEISVQTVLARRDPIEESVRP